MGWELEFTAGLAADAFLNPGLIDLMRQFTFGLLRFVSAIALCLFAVLWSLQKLSGDSGLIEIGDDEVAVVYNRLSGSTRQIDSPGNELFLPFVERIHLQRRSPKQLLLQGAEREPAGLVPEIRLRASDGTLVRFESLAVQYTLRPDEAELALEDTHGDDELAAALIEAHTRSIVRDEYGRYSAEEILLRDNQNAANVITQNRLDEALALHGIEVLELSTPKLRFDSAYEKSVEDRKLANQEVERLKAEFRQLEAERDQRLAALEKEKLIELNKSRLEINEYLAMIDRDGRDKRLKAQQYHSGRVADAQNYKYKLEQQALSMTEQVTARAELLRQEVERLEGTGAALLREAWTERLAQISFRIQPFSHDPEPAGIEVLETTLAIK